MTMNSDKADYNRPRRPAPDTVSYLRSLPLDLEVAVAEIKTFQETETNDVELLFPPTLAAALQAVYEIRHELASLAGDENAAEIIEVLCRIVIPVSSTAARICLDAVHTYALHLSTHRYGSHVLQTILQLTAKSASAEKDLALHEDAPIVPSTDDLPETSELILGLAAELEPAATDLAIHICGSHVLRTIICLLGGVEMVSTSNRNTLRRGKVKPKRKKKKPETESSKEAAGHNGEHMEYIEGCKPDARMQNALTRLTTALTVTETLSGPGNVQRWACHSSAGPVLTVLLHVLTYRDAAAADNNNNSPATRDKQRQWEAAQATPDRHLHRARPEPVYDEDSEAHQVVQRLLCWRNAAEKEKYGADVMYGLAGEPRGSHCLETILRLSPDSVYTDILETGKLTDPQTVKEYVVDDVSNFVVQTVLQTVRTTQQAASVIDALEPAMSYVLDPSNKRRGILWRMVELAASETGKDCQQKILQMICTGFAALAVSSKPNSGEVHMKLNKCIPALLNIQKPARDGDRVALDVAGTRALYHLLRFESAFCKDTLKGLMELAPDEMELLAKDPLGSRCVLDGILEGPVNDTVFAAALKRLLSKLQGRWVAVAIDRVGHHTVKKLFRTLSDIKDKEVLVRELAEGKHRMNGNAMGRSVLEALEVRAYEMNGEKEWSKIVKNNVDKVAWLKEIVDGDTSNKGKKRKKAQTVVESSSQAQKGRVSSSVDAIMDALSIPSDK